MYGAEGNIGRLIFGQREYLVSPRHFCCSPNDNPVLGAMKVLLQGQFLTRLHDDALDLKTVRLHEGFVGAPRAIDPLMKRGLAPVGGLECLNDVFDTLHLIAVGHQNGIWRLNHHDILNPCGGNQPALASDVAIACLMSQHITN